MREIKFRGKRVYNGEWAYGNLFIRAAESPVPETTEDYTQTNIITQDFYQVEDEVDQETVGQYTGLKDKNGKEIYDGDILAKKTTGEIIGWVKGGVRGYCYDVVYVNHPAGEKSFPLFGTVKNDYPDNIVVVGNIYDNPELLEDLGNGI